GGPRQKIPAIRFGLGRAQRVSRAKTGVEFENRMIAAIYEGLVSAKEFQNILFFRFRLLAIADTHIDDHRIVAAGRDNVGERLLKSGPIGLIEAPVVGVGFKSGLNFAIPLCVSVPRIAITLPQGLNKPLSDIGSRLAYN